MFALSLLLLAGCSSGPALPPATAPVASVDVRVLGGDGLARPSGCLPSGAGPGLAGVPVWVPRTAALPRVARLAWTGCGPEAAAMVLPSGSELRVENRRATALTLRWTDERGAEDVRLSPGGSRRIRLGGPQLMHLSAGDGTEAVVVVGGEGAVTDTTGTARLALTEVGAHELWMYHPGVGLQRAEVDLVAGGQVHLDVELAVDRAARAEGAGFGPPS